MAETEEKGAMTRQEFIQQCGRAAGLLVLGGTVGGLMSRNLRAGTIWQIDPAKCTYCNKCASECVLDQSAVKCYNKFEMCGYCDLCTGYFEPRPIALNEGAENQLCPVNAIERRYVEEPYFEYIIDKERCIGCAKCVEGCVQFGNGSFYLQVSHDICVNCNDCNIAKVCPPQAFVRLPANKPYVER